MKANLSRRGTILGFAALVTLVGVGIGVAAIPGTDGVIHGCYKSQNGQLRVIDPDSRGKCVPSEKALDWNATGPPGAPGAPGMSGYEIVTEPASYTAPRPDEAVAVEARAECPTGKRAVGGGGSGNITTPNAFTKPAHLVESRPGSNGLAWIGALGTPDGSFLAVGQGVSGTVYAICVNVAA